MGHQTLLTWTSPPLIGGFDTQSVRISGRTARRSLLQIGQGNGAMVPGTPDNAYTSRVSFVFLTLVLLT